MISTEAIRYKQIIGILKDLKPKVVMEIGTHKAFRPWEWKKSGLFFFYYGFDVFEDGTKELNQKEMNGKGSCTMELAKNSLSGIQHKLYKGLTKDTLPAFKYENVKADFAFIDGGHSIETIQNDWDNVKDCMNPGGVVIFDDYYTLNVPEGFGCNEVVKNIEHEVLPETDVVLFEEGFLGVQLVKVNL